jgi:hypothetical protein
MARKKKRTSVRELRRREKIRKGLRRYHRDVRAVKKATKTTWREAQRLIPKGVRRSGRRGAVLRRGDLLDLARERHAVERETEAQAPAQGRGLEGTSVELTYSNLLPYLIDAAKKGESVAIDALFFFSGPETLKKGPRASELYREFGAAGDLHFARDKDLSRYWRIRLPFYLTFTDDGFTVTGGIDPYEKD